MARQITWTEVPPNQWNEHEMSMDVENAKVSTYKYFY